MYYCKLKDLNQCEINFEYLKEAREWLNNVDQEQLEDGNYVISEGHMFASVQSYDTCEITERHFESHKEFVEIQYLIRGKELFAITQLDHLLKAGEEREQDNYFYEFPKEYSSIILTPGQFLVLMPSDGHASRGKVGNSERVKKVIFKFNA